MAMNCDILMAYSQRREYLGAMNYRNAITLNVQRVFDAMGSSREEPTGMPPLITGVFTGVTVNGVFFGSGYITDFKNPTSTDITENGRHLWKQEVTVEIATTGDASNLGSNQVLTGLSYVYHPQLRNLDENFGFELSQDGDYQYTHTASVKCLNEPSGAGESGYSIARRIASGLLTSTPPLGYIDTVHSGMYTGAGKRYYEETTDRINGIANFQEKFVIQNRDFTKHSVSFDNGFVNITENCTMRHSGTTTVSGIFLSNDLNILERYSGVLNGAYTRCNSLWTTYNTVLEILGSDAYNPDLNNQPSQITKAYDETSQELTYSVIYTNNPTMTASGYSIEREQNFNMSEAGVTEVSEQAAITAYGNKDASLKDFLITSINNEMTGAYGRLIDIWSSMDTCKLMRETKSFSVLGKKANYTVAYTDDPSFLNDGTYLTRSIAIQDNGAVLMHTPYFIVGRSSPLIHNPGHTQFGTATCSVQARLPRPANFYAGSPVRPVALSQMFVDAVNNLLPTIAVHSPLDMFVSKVSYSYTSELTAQISVEARYVYARTSRI